MSENEIYFCAESITTKTAVRFRRLLSAFSSFSFRRYKITKEERNGH
jgi:hypothetical protein